jgi:YVTN family beta-propeller protein
MARVLRTAGIALAVLAFAGCNVAGLPAPAGPRPGEGRLVLYLNGPVAAPLEVTFEIASIEAVREGGIRASVRSSPISINSLEVVERQLLLAEGFLPEGRYRSLSLTAGKARVRLEGKWADLSVPPEGFLLAVDFEIRRGDATALFMTWDVGRTIEREAFFRPAFAFEGRAQELRRVLAYVTNEGSDTVSVIDRSLDRVVSVVAVAARPRGIAVARDTSRAFVVNSGSHTLSVVDVNTNRVTHSTHLEVGASASDAVITPDGRTLYVTNTALNSVSVIDAQSFQTIRTVAVGLRPWALALIPSRAGLLVANSVSNTLSLIDTSRNAVAATIPVDFQPSNLAVNASGSLAFVPHLGSPRLSIVSLSSLKTVKTLTVGVAAAALPEGDGSVGRLFVAGTRSRRVSLFDITLNAELDSIAVGEEPRYLALDPDREKLYVVNRGSDTVTVIDKFSRRVRATIQVGKRPYAIAIVP